MKRLGAAVTAFIMILSLFQIYAHASDKKTEFGMAVDEKEYAIDLELLKYLNIIGDDYTETESMEMSRFEFASCIFKLMNLAESKISDVYFTDTSNREVNTLAGCGYIPIPENRIFNGDEKITFYEATEICLNLLGFGRVTGSDADIDVMQLANRLGIAENCDRNAAVSKREAATLLVNTLLTEELSLQSITKKDDGYIFNGAQNQTLLSVIYDLNKDEGTVIANQYTSIYDNVGKTDEGEICIDNVVYKSDNEQLNRKLIGQNVCFFYHSSKKETAGSVVLMLADNDSEWHFTSNDEIEVRDTTVIEYQKDGAKTQKLSIVSPILIYNGETKFDAGKNEIAALLKKDNIIVDVIKNSIPQYETVISVYEYVDCELQNFDTTQLKLYAKELEAEKLYEYDFGDANYAVVLLNDDEILPEEMLINEIISAAVSESGKMIEVRVCRDTVSGAVSEIRKNRHTEVKVDDKYYSVKDGLAEKMNISLDNTYSFTKNYFDKIVKKKGSSLPTGFSLGYIYGRSEQSSFDDCYIYKIYTSLGKSIDLTCTGSLLLNQVKSDAKDIDAVLAPGGVLKNQLILVKFNEKNEIKELKTNMPDSEDENALRLVDNRKVRRYFKSFDDQGTIVFYGDTNNSIERKNYGLTEDTVVFKIQTASENCDDIGKTIKTSKIKDTLDLTTGYYYDVDLYRYQNESAFIDAVILYTKPAPLTNSTSYLVNSCYKTIDDDGLDSVEIEGIDIQTGAPVHLMTERAANYKYGSIYDTDEPIGYKKSNDISSVIGEGDVIQIGENATGKRDYVRILFDYSEDKTCYGFTDSTYTDYAYKFESSTYADYLNLGINKTRYTYGALHSKYDIMSSDLKTQQYTDRKVYTISSLEDPSKALESYTKAAYWGLNIIFNPNKKTNKAYYGSIKDVPDYVGANGKEYGKVFTVIGTNSQIKNSIFYLNKIQ